VNHNAVMSISEYWLAGWFAVSVAGLFLLARYVGKPRRATRASLSEEGVSYSLSFVLVVPIIMFFCVLVVETVFIHMARIGVSYAAYAGNRSAVVWISAKPEKVRKERITQAVLTALTPFTWNRLDVLDPPSAIAGTTAPGFGLAYALLTKDADESRTVPTADAVKRYLFASGKMGMSVKDEEGMCTFKLEYRYRCLFGFAGRILDKDHTAPFVIVMEAENTLPTERPGGIAKELGIDYHSE
jgi:hypothetical protein